MIDFITLSYLFTAALLILFSAIVYRSYVKSRNHYAQLQRNIEQLKKQHLTSKS